MIRLARIPLRMVQFAALTVAYRIGAALEVHEQELPDTEQAHADMRQAVITEAVEFYAEKRADLEAADFAMWTHEYLMRGAS